MKIDENNSIIIDLIKKYLSIPGSSAVSERQFSLAEIVFTKRRNRLKGDKID